MSGKSIVRDIYVSVPRVDESGSPTGTTAYVFAVRPRPSLLASSSGSAARSQRMRRRLSMGEPSTLSIAWREPGTSRRYSDPSAFMDVDLLPPAAPRAALFVHEVARSYAQCRVLYKQLLAFTDCRSMATCGCILGSCPFWSMHAVLKALPFPRRSPLLSLHWTHKSITQHRLHTFHQFMASLMHHLQLYREDFFIDRVSSTEFHGCKVIGALEAFLELTDDVVERFRAAEHRQQLKMNLQGWQSDRKNLYFCDEDNQSDSDDDWIGEPTHHHHSHHSAAPHSASTQFDTMGVDVDEILRGLAQVETSGR